MTSEPHTPASALQLSALDNVAVARQALVVGQTLALGAVPAVLVREPIPSGHKVALQPIAIGQPVYKYGQRIGLASADIAPGQHVHVHNLAMAAAMAPSSPARATCPPCRLKRPWALTATSAPMAAWARATTWA